MPAASREELSILKQIKKVKEDIAKLDDIKMSEQSLTKEQIKQYNQLEKDLKSLEEQTVTTAGKTQILIEAFKDASSVTEKATKNFKKLSDSNVEKNLRDLAKIGKESAKAISNISLSLEDLQATGKGGTDLARGLESYLAIEQDIAAISKDKSALATADLGKLQVEIMMTRDLLILDGQATDEQLKQLDIAEDKIRNLRKQQFREDQLNTQRSKAVELQQKMDEFMGQFNTKAGAAVAIFTGITKILQFGAKETLAIQSSIGGTLGDSASLAANFNMNVGLVGQLGTRLTGVTKNIRDAAIQSALAADNLDMMNNLAVATSDAALAMQVGLDPSNIAQLAQTMSEVTDASREGASAQLVTVQALAMQNRVAPAKVFESMSQNATVLAAMTDGSADSMGRLAVLAAKAGVELSQLESIADSLLNIETSIAAEFEAEVLLGRQLNLDAARRFALNNDNEGLIREIQKNLQGTSFGELNRLQRQSLAAALGTDVASLGRIIARSGSGEIEDVAQQQLKTTGELVKQGATSNDLLGKILQAVVFLGAASAMSGLGSVASGRGGPGGGSGFANMLRGNKGPLRNPATGQFVKGNFMNNLKFNRLVRGGGALTAVTAIPELMTSQDLTKDGLGILGRIGGGVAAGAGLGALGMNPATVIAGGILGGIFGETAVEGLVDLFRGGFANGGPVTESGIAMVGERGPELVALGRGSHVVPNHYLGGYQAGATNMQISDPETHRALMTIASHLESINTNTANTSKGVGNIGIATGA